MLRINLILFFMLILAAQTYGQVEYSQSVGKNLSQPKVYLDFINRKSETKGKTDLYFLLEVPYASVQFKKTGKGFTANYQVDLTIYDSLKSRIVVEKLWSEKIVTDKYSETYSKENHFISYRKLTLAPLKYRVVCSVEDETSKEPIVFESDVRVRSFSDSIDVSDILLINKIIEGKNGREIIPNISHNMKPGASVTINYELYSNIDRAVTINYIVREINRNITSTRMVSRNIKTGTNIIEEVVDEVKLKIGNYTMNIVIADESGNELCKRAIKFRVQLPGIPLSLDALDTAIDQLVYIASADEIDSLKEGKNYDEKLKKFLAFWKKRDPDPKSSNNEMLNEYYRRIDYANKHFEGYYDGWKTDMGMVYVTLGPPDQVEREPMSIDSKPYEIWYYYNLNKQFVFVDDTGFGDYRLVNPQYGEWNRYRP
ncbi:MAG: GWxTD domain-containing protein [Chlorobi bacterium]|nr:GWxTD domain-containing protein [Chlorobiota bacterium]